MSEIKDSGNRRQFSTGAVRDISDDKGRMDLTSMDILSNFLEFVDKYKSDDKLEEYGMFNLVDNFMNTGNTMYINTLLMLFINREYNGDINTAILEYSIHLQQGALKYTERNWEIGIPCHCFVDSGLRHGVKYFRGDTDEPHNRAFMWNFFGLLWTIRHHPELIDLPFNKEPEKDSHQSVLLEEDHSFNRPAPDVEIECKDMSGDEFNKKHNISSSGLMAVENPPSLIDDKKDTEEEILLKVKFKIKDSIESVKDMIKKCKCDVAGFESGYYITPLRNSYMIIRNFNQEVYDNQFTEYFYNLYLLGDPKFTQDNEVFLYLKLDNKDSKRFINNLLSIPKEIRKEFYKSITFYTYNKSIFSDTLDISYLRLDLLTDKNKIFDDNGDLIYACKKGF